VKDKQHPVSELCRFVTSVLPWPLIWWRQLHNYCGDMSRNNSVLGRYTD